MADFISNLLNRFNRPEAGVQARPVALFEPQTNLDLSAWAAARPLSRENKETVEQQGDLQCRATKTDFLKQSTTPEEACHSRAEIEPRPRPVPAGRQTQPAAAPISGPPAQLGYLVVQPRFQGDQPALEPQLHPEIISVPQGDDARLKPERGTSLEEGTPLRGEPANPRREENHPKPDHKTVIQPHRREAAESLRLVYFNPQIAAEKNSSLAEHVINVTIGRVEVLAVPPAGPAKPQKASPSIPVMSLDEYLKSRDQERQL